ncbi:hypothetical protein EW145_g8048 [Phellinidium pouzarii]|uniref:Macrofage activating glycoprotein n=1 Tax=Phellinidium pouzarii TaxID=167371 RepID=A0A4S4KAI3_9AGAM|nr:hypothetical protein EW145_g8048 [Phellinidium pouzarii]
MPRFALSLAFVAIAAAGIFAQDPPMSTYPATPLANKHFSYPSGIPYQADTDTNLIRGAQSGYNLCNSTTEGQDSLCQTSFLNHLDDFCLWAPPEPNSTIADTEGEEVAWCTKPGRGTRVIPPGALQGVQYMRTPDYIQVVGFIDQTKVNIADGDYGGELDPHGADLRGNPLGGLLFSNAFNASNSDNNTFTQAIEWTNFMGGGSFCLKVCDPAGAHAADYCQHIFDRIGCAYNAPNNAQNGTFEVCLGDNQDFPGVYTSSGTVMTYTQPPESLGAITTMPYTPVVPASSSCTTFASADLYSSAASVFSSIVTTTATSTASGSAKTGSGSGSGSLPSATRSSSSADVSGVANGASMGASSMLMGSGAGAGAVIGLMGLLFSMTFLA